MVIDNGGPGSSSSSATGEGKSANKMPERQERQAASRKITRGEAERLAKKMRAAGGTYQEIAGELTSKGWRSLTGGPATIGGVASLLGRRPFTRAVETSSVSPREQEQATAVATGPDNGHRHMLEILDRLLSTSSMNVADRVAACQLLISAHLGTAPRGGA